ncbi:ABC transporter substrate-binding protein [Nocardia tengchongensis]|uniref:ABC transporter substrate-binding protein n=1 Tax=Nocardia tengchongensis TaxID=2055889 RepID=UPI0036584180
MNRTLTLGLSIAAAATLALSTSACTTSQGGGGGTVSGDTVRLSLLTDVANFDPIKGASAGDYVFNRLLFSSLVALDENNVVVPRLATSWDVGTTGGTLTLKKGLTCSDGSPLTAAQVAASLDRYRSQGTATGQVFGPDNAGDKTTITADDNAGTIAIKLTNPWGELLTGLAHQSTSIVCKSGLAAPDALGLGNVDGAGTGPYTLTKNERGTAYELALRPGFDAYPRYKSLPAGEPVKTMQIGIVKNESSLANQLHTGQADFGAFTGPDAARFTDGYTVVKSPYVRFFLMFNQRPGLPGADPAFRRAVAQAVDAQAFGKVFGGGAAPIASYVEPAVSCANKDTALLVPNNLDAAKAQLGGKSIRVVGSNAVAQGAGNTYVAEALRVGGADVKLNNADNATLFGSVLTSGEWDVYITPSITGSLLIGAQLFSGAQPPAGRNYGAVNNPEFVRGYGAAVRTVDPTAKCDSWASAQKSLLNAVDTVPLSTVDVHYVFRNGISASAPQGNFDPATMRITG